MQKRRRFTHVQSLEERLAGEAKRLRELASSLPPGADREATLRKARLIEAGGQMSEWLTSPGTMPRTVE